jgi:hypothetical protein
MQLVHCETGSNPTVHARWQPENAERRNWFHEAGLKMKHLSAAAKRPTCIHGIAHRRGSGVLPGKVVSRSRTQRSTKRQLILDLRGR